MKCVIVEDETMARRSLERMCEKMNALDLVASFQTAEEAKEYLAKEEVDLLFLDVEMPGLSGIELVHQIKIVPQIIFTSAKKEYAFEAFQLDATDFIQKPVAFPEFKIAVEKAIQLELKKKNQDAIYIRNNGRLTRISLDSISYFENVGDYIKVITKNDQYTIYATMKYIELKLPKKKFIKVHRTYIVNISEIIDIENNSILIGKKIIPISRANRQILMNRLNII